MKRMVVALLGVLLLTGLVAVGGRQENLARVYSVAEVLHHLSTSPRAWVGRTVLVRGVAEACLASQGAPLVLACGSWQADLFDPGPITAGATLPLRWEGARPLQAILRRLPLAGLLLPVHAARWGAVATYRVQLRAISSDACTSLPRLATPNSVLDQNRCPRYEALLQDAAISAP